MLPIKTKDSLNFKISSSLLKKISKKILSQDYNLSLFLGDKKTSKQINHTYRNKNKSTNILSFPLSPSEGEIILDTETIKEEAKQKNKNYSHYLTYIFIHGLLHLKGFKHGSKMEKEEDKVLNEIYPNHNLF